MARPDAVIFDLFGTLVPELPRDEFWASVDAIAAGQGIDPAAFRRGWEATTVERQTGRLGDIEANVRAICEQLGVGFDASRLPGALRRRGEMYERWFFPRDGALETLGALRARGYPLALVSQCAPDTPAIWRASSLARSVDVEVFSSEVGMRKPDPAIYSLAAERLGVACDGCLYVGDGAYGELTGAAAVGMTPYLLRDPSVDQAAMLTPERDTWAGASLADLREVLDLAP
ncbi:MAG TPA: HAD family hydrolase [Actinomycetota bacterium]|jgi:putative hydrolase of the HAD superfamily|nr:HAD family hydrolase [Actinomycetota bacterium]